MTTIKERLYVRCPFGKAPSYLEYYLDTLASADAEGKARLLLEVSLAGLGLPSGLVLGREVTARFAPIHEGSFGSRRTALHWEPTGGGPFPAFDGTLTIEQDEDYGSSALEIVGSYHPPLGWVGAAFDAALGSRIARATAHELLRTLRRRLEADWAVAQAKPAHDKTEVR